MGPDTSSAGPTMEQRRPRDEGEGRATDVSKPIGIMGVGVRRIKPAPRRLPCPLGAGPEQNHGVLFWMDAGL
jgi:hypothetical protein